jgi:hypothetical protein
LDAVVDGLETGCAIASMERESLVSWPDHMVAVFRAVGRVIKGKQLRPERLDQLAPDNRDIVANHKVTISHVPKAETGEKRGRYDVVITGPRVEGKWRLSPGEMDRLCRKAAVDDTVE